MESTLFRAIITTQPMRQNPCDICHFWAVGNCHEVALVRAGEDLPCCAPQLSHRLPTMSPSPVKMIKKKELVLNSVAEFLGIWAVRGEASLSLSTKDGVTTIAFSHTLSGHPDDPLLPPPAPTGRNRRQRGPARKERDRMRAARYQAAKDSASQARPQGSTIQCDQCDKSFKTESGLKIHAGKSHKPIATVTSSTSAAASATGNSLRILTSPSPESGRRRIMSCAGRVERTPSFSNLDGATPSPLLPSSTLRAVHHQQQHRIVMKMKKKRISLISEIVILIKLLHSAVYTALRRKK